MEDLTNYVGFPGLGLSFHINPVAFSLFGKDVYWYGLILALGVVAGVLIAMHFAKKSGIRQDNILDIALYGVPSAVICARIYYCIFSWEQYRDNPWKVFYVWEGGIAIYGAVIGAVLSAYVYCRVKKLPVKRVFDACIIGVITGQVIGRWGNFVNKEAFGTETTLPWRMEIASGMHTVCVHPTFLYESLWNFIGIFVLAQMQRRKKFDGETFYTYFVWYGIGRFFIEGLRTDSLYWGPIRFSQAFAAITALLGLIALFYTRLKHNKISKP